MGVPVDPVSATVTGIGLGLNVFGQYQSGKQADAVSKYNQQVKEREAQAAEQRAMVESRKQAQEAARRMSTLKAKIGASGAAGDVGAPLSVLGEQAKQDELENLMIGYNAGQESTRLRQEGKMIRYQGKAKKRASRIEAGSTLLTGFSEFL